MKKLICLLVFSFITSLALAQKASQIDSLLLAAKKLQGDAKAEVLGKIFFFQFYASPKKAQQTAYQIWELAKVSENLKLKGQSASTMLIMHALLLQKHDSVMYWADKSTRLHKQTGDSIFISRDLHNVGVSHWMNSRYDSGLYYYLESVKIVEHLDVPEELVGSYTNIGLAYYKVRKYKQAFFYLKKALQIASKKSSPEFLMQIQINISSSYTGINELDSAVLYAKRALKLAQETGSTIGLHHIYVTLADYNYSIKDYTEGLNYINKARAIPKELQDPNYIIQTEYTYTTLLVALKKYSEAEKIALQGINLAINKETGDADLLMRLYQLMPIVYANLGQVDKVQTYMENINVLSDSLSKIEILSKTSELQTKYETEKKEQQIKDLEQQKTIDELKSKTEISSLQAQRSILGLVLLAPISLLIGGGWYVNRRRLYLKLEAEQKERAKQLSELKALRSQMNPHFIFNALNSIQDFIMLSEKENAQHYLGKFATLMRGFLDSSSKEKISLEKELPLLKSYIELEGLRLGEEFSYEIIFNNKIDEEQLEEIEIPPLLIQPYLENAFKHGLLHKMGEKKLLLEFDKVEKQNENFLQLKITDNGIGRQKSAEINARKAKTHQSFATQAISKRLELMKNQSVSNKNIEVEINDLKDNQGNAKGTEIVILTPTNIPINRKV
ncbi:histidine kinase [Bernardetia sp. MNP-M8]|uniref:tetratricopeptide repeat-containing sensor histidine kinase n=1 Tax=Bernardetia sp. MNP-M8 TaxID=3127470 RepID=UPI0030D06E66